MTFGGFAPFLTTWLIAATGSKLALAAYVMFAAVLGIVAILSDGAIGRMAPKSADKSWPNSAAP